jgi:hypothetical protein
MRRLRLKKMQRLQYLVRLLHPEWGYATKLQWLMRLVTLQTLKGVLDEASRGVSGLHLAALHHLLHA